MRFYFENTTSFDSDIKRVVKDLIIKNDVEISGNILIDELPYDEVEDYETRDGFVKRHKKSCDFYYVYYIVCGNWKQPLGLVAVAGR